MSTDPTANADQDQGHGKLYYGYHLVNYDLHAYLLVQITARFTKGTL